MVADVEFGTDSELNWVSDLPREYTLCKFSISTGSRACGETWAQSLSKSACFCFCSHLHSHLWRCLCTAVGLLVLPLALSFMCAVAHPHCTCSLLVFLLQGYKATGSSESPQSRYSVGLGVCKATIIHKNTNQSGQTAGKACSCFLHKPCVQYVATLSVFPWWSLEEFKAGR